MRARRRFYQGNRYKRVHDVDKLIHQTTDMACRCRPYAMSYNVLCASSRVCDWRGVERQNERKCFSNIVKFLELTRRSRANVAKKLAKCYFEVLSSSIFVHSRHGCRPSWLEFGPDTIGAWTTRPQRALSFPCDASCVRGRSSCSESRRLERLISISSPQTPPLLC